MTQEWEDIPQALLRRFLLSADAYIRTPDIARLLAFAYARSASEITLCAACAFGGQAAFADRRTFVGIGRELYADSRKRPDLYLAPSTAAAGRPANAILIEVKVPWPGSNTRGEQTDFKKLASVQWGCFLTLYHSFESRPPWGGHPGDSWPVRHIHAFEAERDAYIEALDRGSPWWQGEKFPFDPDYGRGHAQLMAWLVGTGWSVSGSP